MKLIRRIENKELFEISRNSPEFLLGFFFLLVRVQD